MNILHHLLKPELVNNKKVYTSNIVFYGKRFYDDNIFFTALIGFTLQYLKPTFSNQEQQIVNTIINNCNHAFSFFKNKHGKLSYNFYQTTPFVNQYSGIKFLNKFTALQIPDDLDSTSLIYLSKSENSESENLKNMFTRLSNDGKPLKSFPKRFKNTKAYRTWFATKMNHDMDICVMCNVLIWVHQNHVKFTKEDEDSIDLISTLIQENILLKKAYLYAPHYKNKAIVLYHVIRCVSIIKHPKLLQHKDYFIQQCNQLLPQVNHPLEKVILYTSLHKLHVSTKFSMEFNTEELENFYWFKANPFSISKPWIKNIFSRKNFLHLQYKCTTYNWVLLLELQQISQSRLNAKNQKISIKSS